MCSLDDLFHDQCRKLSAIAHEMLMQVHKNRVALYLQSMSSYELETGRVLLKLPHLTMRSRALMMQVNSSANSEIGFFINVFRAQ